MVDYKIRTFLALYEIMNYRAAAEKLNMTQPAVTQHIHALEKEYGCKLFTYDGRKLTRTRDADLLANYSRSMLYNEELMKQEMGKHEKPPLRIGATKTIGSFVIEDMVSSYLSKQENNITLIVDNTERLLEMLEHGELDFAIIEGNFDKSRYGHRLMRMEPFMGMCAEGYPFAGKELQLNELFDETLLLREKGSGTRDIFEQVLKDYGYSPENFKRTVCISDFNMICYQVAKGIGISFAYKAVAEKSRNIASFTLKNISVVHEFNYVYLKGTPGEASIDEFEKGGSR